LSWVDLMTDSNPSYLASPSAGGDRSGDLLRRAREAQGFSLAQLASQIKVSPSKLEALEQGQHDRLGDSNFTRALALTVCRTLRMDATEVLAGLPAARLHALSEKKLSINAPFRDHGSVPALFDRGGRLNLRELWKFKWLAPLALLTVAAIIYALPESVSWPAWLSGTELGVQAASDLNGDDATTQPSSIEVAADHAAPLVAEDVTHPESGASAAMSEASGVTTATSEASSVPSSGVSSAVPSSQAAMAVPVDAPLRMALTDHSWIEVVDATGSKLFSGIALSGENLALQGQAPFNVRIGNASAVQVSYKGQPVSLTNITRNNTARVELK
jgi:cytoskeleton protein RodZ